MSNKSQPGKTYRLAVVCTGLRYDVMQHVALAVGLQRVGNFSVKLVTHAVYEPIAQKYGLRFQGLKGDPSAVMKTSAFRDAVAENSVLKIAALFKKETDGVIEMNLEAIHNATCGPRCTQPVDAIITSIACLTECSAIGQKYQRPVILAPLLPYSPSGELALPHLVPEPSKYSFLNRLSYEVSGALLWSIMSGVYNRFRTKVLGIGPQTHYELEGVPQVAAFSPQIVPPPADWGRWIHVTGHWNVSSLDQQGVADVQVNNPTLCAMLASTAAADLNQKPIVVNFEGVPLPDPIAFLRAAYQVASKANCALIFCAGDADIGSIKNSPRLADLPDIVFELPGQQASSAAPSSGKLAKSAVPRVLVVQDAPYAWLFPQASVIVHQGGAAITQAAMTAGVPSVAFPAFGEQHFWAARISALGVGPGIHFPLRDVAARLEECVGVTRQPVVVQAAAQLGLNLQSNAHDGVIQAVMTIRDTLNRPQHRHCGVTCTWEPDESRQNCSLCSKPFTLLNRRRHCRSCGRLACTMCFTQRCHLPGYPENAPQITCEKCLDYRRAYFAMHVGESAVPDMPQYIQSSGAGALASGSAEAAAMDQTASSIAAAAAAEGARLTSPTVKLQAARAGGPVGAGAMASPLPNASAANVGAGFDSVDLLSRASGNTAVGGGAGMTSPGPSKAGAAATPAKGTGVEAALSRLNLVTPSAQAPATPI